MASEERDTGILATFLERGDSPDCFRFFSRTGGNAGVYVLGWWATFTAVEYIKSETVVRTWTDSAGTAVPVVVLNDAMCKEVIADCLLRRGATVEFYDKNVRGAYECVQRGSPGNIADFEASLFEQEESAVQLMASGALIFGSNTTGGAVQMGLAALNATLRHITVAEYEDSTQLVDLDVLLSQTNVKELTLTLPSAAAQDTMKEQLQAVRRICDRLRIGLTLQTAKESQRGAGASVTADALKDLLRVPQDRIQLLDLPLGSRAVQELLRNVDLCDPNNQRAYYLRRVMPSTYVKLDSAAVEALHLFSARPDPKGMAPSSIYGWLNRCCTGMGSRLLRQWLLQPLRGVSEIEQRQAMVQLLVDNTPMRDGLVSEVLRRCGDMDRMNRKLMRRRVALKDMRALLQFVEVISPCIRVLRLGAAVGGRHGKLVMDEYIAPLEEIADHIKNLRVLIESSLGTLHGDLKAVEVAIEKEYALVLKRYDWNERTMKVEFHTSYGYVFRVSRKEDHQLRNTKDFIILSTSKDGVRFVSDNLAALSSRYKDISAEYDRRQEALKRKLVDTVASYLPLLDDAKEMLAALDVFVAWATVARESPRPMVCPTVRSSEAPAVKSEFASPLLQFHNLRHPLVELRQPDFHANSAELTTEASGVVITGPNMGGKSTFMRSVGVAVVLAQIGCFVPADAAELCVRDAVMCRVGATDHLSQGVSTFMVEMLESAAILSHATPQTLAIVDELGRGTSTYDGFGLAWAIAKAIGCDIGATLLFSTHFHEMTELPTVEPRLRNFHFGADVNESEGTLRFLYTLEPGPCGQSYGLYVAALARMPPEVIHSARRKAAVLESFESASAGARDAIASDTVRKAVAAVAADDEAYKRVQGYARRVRAATDAGDDTELKRVKLEVTQDPRQSFLTRVLSGLGWAGCGECVEGHTTRRDRVTPNTLKLIRFAFKALQAAALVDFGIWSTLFILLFDWPLLSHSRRRIPFFRSPSMFQGVEKDFYAGATDDELAELLSEWEAAFATQRRRAGNAAQGSNTAGRDPPRSDSHPSSSSLESNVTSTGTAFVRHRRYVDHTIAYRHASDPYDSKEEAQRGGAAGRGDSSKPSRMLLGDCVRELYQAISLDWVDADPVMITTAEDLIVVYFRLDKRQSRDVLRRYMNGCVLRNLTCRKYDLRKVPEGWNKETEDGHIMFTLRPLWVSPQRFLPKDKNPIEMIKEIKRKQRGPRSKKSIHNFGSAGSGALSLCSSSVLDGDFITSISLILIDFELFFLDICSKNTVPSFVAPLDGAPACPTPELACARGESKKTLNGETFLQQALASRPAAPSTIIRFLFASDIMHTTAAELDDMAHHRGAAPYVPTFLKASSPQHRSPPTTCNSGVGPSPRSYKDCVVRAAGLRRVYSRDQLLALRAPALRRLGETKAKHVEPYGVVPMSFALMAEAADQHAAALDFPTGPRRTRRLHEEFLDGRAAARLPRYPCPQQLYSCAVCAAGGAACKRVQGWLDEIREETRAPTGSRALRCLAQPPEVFRNLLRMSMALESKRGSSRLRWIVEQYPQVSDRVRTFLCGDVNYVPLPPVTAHEEWEEMIVTMGFDAIRDNRTRIITDFSRHWKRRTIPYEQFVFFYDFRDRHPPATVKNIVTRPLKPGMVAMLSMNLRAMELLHHHNFLMPEDEYWEVFRFLEAAAGGNTAKYYKVRHLGLYLSSTQGELRARHPVNIFKCKFNDGAGIQMKNCRLSCETLEIHSLFLSLMSRVKWNAEPAEEGRSSNRGSGGFFETEAGFSCLPLRRRDVNESPYKLATKAVLGPSAAGNSADALLQQPRLFVGTGDTLQTTHLHLDPLPRPRARDPSDSWPQGAKAAPTASARPASSRTAWLQGGLDRPLGTVLDFGSLHGPEDRPHSSMWGGSEDDLGHTISSMSGTADDVEEDGEAPPQRLSRHIPLRDGMDYPLAAFNLTQRNLGNTPPRDPSRTATPPPTGAGQQKLVFGGGLSFGAGGSQQGIAATSSMYGSFSDSIVSDDSSFMTSLYSEKLAEKLCAEEVARQGRDAGSASGPRRHVRQLGGGEVLQFFPNAHGTAGGAGTKVSPRPKRQPEQQDGNALVSLTESLRRRRAQTEAGALQRPHRQLSSHPIRVLVAQQFTPGSSQLLDWGCNNKLAIGLQNNFYVWNAENATPTNLVSLQPTDTVERVLWIQKCSYVAIASSAGVTRIFDGEQGKYLRVLGEAGSDGGSPQERITGLAVRGPMLAASSSDPRGITRIYDLRIKDALVQSLEGHSGGASCLAYCPLEPHHLATGGADGSICVWDGRRSSTPRYEMRGVHSGAVSVLQWNPQRSRRLLSGGDDGSRGRPAELNAAATTMQSLTRAHKTLYPITGVVWKPDGDKIVTSHSGKGHLQLRQADTFQNLGSFSAVDTDASLSCLTLAPNGEHVCAAQEDETLKMWHSVRGASVLSRSQHEIVASTPSDSIPSHSFFKQDLKPPDVVLTARRAFLLDCHPVFSSFFFVIYFLYCYHLHQVFVGLIHSYGIIHMCSTARLAPGCDYVFKQRKETRLSTFSTAPSFPSYPFSFVTPCSCCLILIMDPNETAGGPTISRKDRKRQEKEERVAKELRELSAKANCVNQDGDNPFSVTFEEGGANEGSKNIVFNKVSVSVNGKTLFLDAVVKLSAGSRYGLMGPNGRGKSTILRLLNSRELPVQSNLDILLVEQEQEFTASEESAVEAVMRSHKKQIAFMEEAQMLQSKMELSQEEMERLHFLEEELDIMGASQAEAKARRILFGLGFPSDWHDRPTKSFSGGWRKRVALASAMFIEPDVLLLDEPTNHLDLNAVIWLESYLERTYSENTRRPKILVVVSHDAGFLDAVCSHMVHVESFKLSYYKGGYSSFEEQLKQRHQEIDKKYEGVMKTIKEKKRNGMSNAQVDEWIKNQVNSGRMEPQFLEKRRDYVVNFPFPVPLQLRDACVCKLEEVAFHYPNGPELFRSVNCALWTDSRITLCGPNGIGKSTLLNLMTGVLEPTEGHVTLNRQVRIGRYNQHFVDKLPLEKTPVECIQALGIPEEDKARRLLGSFGLEGIVHKNQIATLSGGQKARVAFAAISAETPHFLLLDEPTNHLDVESIDALCESVRNFKGGVLVVTHDSRLIESTDMQIWVAGAKNVRKFDGDLADYKEEVRKMFEEEEKSRQLERQQAADDKALERALKKEGVAAENMAEAKMEQKQKVGQEAAEQVDQLFLMAMGKNKKKKSKATADALKVNITVSYSFRILLHNQLTDVGKGYFLLRILLLTFLFVCLFEANAISIRLQGPSPEPQNYVTPEIQTEQNLLQAGIEPATFRLERFNMLAVSWACLGFNPPTRPVFSFCLMDGFGLLHGWAFAFAGTPFSNFARVNVQPSCSGGKIAGCRSANAGVRRAGFSTSSPPFWRQNPGASAQRNRRGTSKIAKKPTPAKVLPAVLVALAAGGFGAALLGRVFSGIFRLKINFGSLGKCSRNMNLNHIKSMKALICSFAFLFNYSIKKGEYQLIYSYSYFTFSQLKNKDSVWIFTVHYYLLHTHISAVVSTPFHFLLFGFVGPFSFFWLFALCFFFFFFFLLSSSFLSF
eukprot:gene4167-3008_t